MDFRGMFARLLRSIAGYVTKQTGEYNRKDTQDGSIKDKFYKIKTASHISYSRIMNSSNFFFDRFCEVFSRLFLCR